MRSSAVAPAASAGPAAAGLPAGLSPPARPYVALQSPSRGSVHRTGPLLLERARESRGVASRRADRGENAALPRRRHRPPRGWLPVEPERQALVASQLFPETPAHSSIGDSQELPWAPGAAARQHGDIASISTATSHQLQLSELEL